MTWTGTVLMTICWLLAASFSAFAQINDTARSVQFGVHLYYTEINRSGTHAVVAAGNAVTVVDLKTEEKVLSIPVDHTGTGYWGAAFDPTGTRILALSSRAGIIRDAVTGDSLVALQTMDGDSIAFGRYSCFGRNGLRVYVGCNDGVIRGWDATTGALVQRLVDSTVAYFTLMPHPTEEKLLAATNHGAVRVWDLTTEDTIQSFRHPEPKRAEIARARYNHDGSIIAMSLARDSLVTLLDASTGQHIRTLNGHSAFVTGLAFHPYGRHLFTNAQDGRTNVWDLQSGSLVQSLLTGINYDLYITPDGRTMVGTGFRKLDIRSLTLTAGIPDGSRRRSGLSVQVFPNPADKEIQASLHGLANDPIRLTLYDQTGSRVLESTQPVPAHDSMILPLDISVLPAGLYLCVLRSSGQTATTVLQITR